LGKEAKPFQREVERWLTTNGREWTCKRLKGIWNAALHLRNGDKKSAISIYQNLSIAYHSDGTPKGSLRPVVSRFISAQRPGVIKRAAAVLRFYTSLVLDDVSPAQRRKAVTAISGVSKSPVAKKEGLQIYRNKMRETGRKWTQYFLGLPEEVPEISLDYTSSASRMKGLSYYYSRNRLPKAVKAGKDPFFSMAMSFMTETWVPDILDKDVPCYEMRQHIRQQDNKWDNGYTGRVLAIQEQGCKARVVFQPTAWLQLAFEPMHQYLASINERQSSCCVTDQVRGAYAILDHMQNTDFPVFCSDLSSATDRFPREFSLGVLDAIGLHRYAEALEEVCARTASTSLTKSGEIKYEVGQPMGLYGSFPLFHLSNTIVAEVAYRKVLDTKRSVTIFPGIKKPYLVLGDDIVFSDEKVYSAYNSFMRSAGVEISRDKSFSGDVTEFAGFIGVRTNKGATVFRPYKTPEGALITNPVEFLASLGPKASKINSYWRRQFECYRQVQSTLALDLSPLVPSDKSPGLPSNGGTNQVLIRCCQTLAGISDKPLPDLSGETKINRIPLFHEQGATIDRRTLFDPSTFAPQERKEKAIPMRRLSAPLKSLHEARKEVLKGTETNDLIRQMSNSDGTDYELFSELHGRLLMVRDNWDDFCEETSKISEVFARGLVNFEHAYENIMHKRWSPGPNGPESTTRPMNHGQSVARKQLGVSGVTKPSQPSAGQGSKGPAKTLIATHSIPPRQRRIYQNPTIDTEVTNRDEVFNTSRPIAAKPERKTQGGKNETEPTTRSKVEDPLRIVQQVLNLASELESTPEEEGEDFKY
jgi:hypothetical protein